MKVIIAGGGSGGHIFPAIAIAREVQRQLPGSKILFVGAVGKMEERLVPSAGYELRTLPIRGLDRGSVVANLSLPFRVLSSLWQARKILKEYSPDVVVGVGGYASAPVLRVAAAMGVRTLIQEQNSHAGLTNRLLAKYVDRVCVAFGGMDAYFPQEKIVFTGNPLRSDFSTKVDLEEARNYFNVGERQKVVLVVGGSLGAKVFNEVLKDSYELLRGREDVFVIWQIGKNYILSFGDCETVHLNNVWASDFVDRMDLAYALADVVVARAGAITISELTVLGKCVVLVPSPNVVEDHQNRNAQALVDAEACVLVNDADAKNDLWDIIDELLQDDQRRRMYEESMSALGVHNAAERIVNEMIELVESTQN